MKSKKLIAILFIIAGTMFTNRLLAQEEKIEDKKTVTVKMKVGETSDNETDEKIQNQDTIRFKLGNMNVWLFEANDRLTQKVKVLENDSSVEKTIEINEEKDFSLDEKDDDFEIFWSGIGLGISGYVSPDNSIMLPSESSFLKLDYSKSLSFKFNFLEHNVSLVKEHLNLVTGLGLEWNSYALANNNVLVKDSSYLSFFEDSVIDYNKNKLRSTYLNIPLLVQLDLGDQAVHLSAGVIAGVRLWSSYKQVYEDQAGNNQKLKISDNYHLNPFRYGAMVRAGFKNFDVFATYDLSPFFQQSEGPELHAFSVGVTLLNF